ncbi:aminoglycoside phosphotransferase family protein [Legionella pneumophila]|uniref:aminoglycoside phosphotransferase family protein n=1 Tax=Legionella pneumophila TaxID=446 RepID=UPI003EF07C9C
MNIQPLIDKLKLGDLKVQPKLLKGGALHTMSKIETSNGAFAIKRLNPHITAKSHFKNAYEHSEQIANEMAKNTIPAVNALSFNNEYVINVDTDHYIIYPYIDGHLLDESKLTLEHARSIGELYSLIHSANIHHAETDEAHYDYFDDAHWVKLIERSKHSDLIALLPVILSWNQAYFLAIPAIKQESVITHRDMHIQNVLWDSQGKPHIIDWESAGLMNPMLEIIGYGLEWSGIILYQKVNIPFLKKLITVYNQHSSKTWTTSPHQAFMGWLGHCVLAWTEFNIHRMIGEVTSDEAEILKGREIIEEKMMPCINYIKTEEVLLKSLLETLFSTR